MELRIPVIYSDQWQIYEVFLELPFPENVLTLQSSQRPVFPRLIFLLDIELFSGNQWFPQLIGMLLAIVTIASLAYLAIKDATITNNTKYAAIAVFSLMLFWMGSSRTLIHSNESASAYLVTASYLLSIISLYRAGNRLSMPGSSITHWVILSGILCFVATFSFGTGIATYPAIIVTALLLRIPLKYILILVVFFALAAGIYIQGLLSENNAQILTSFKPLSIIDYAFKWLSTPVIYLATGFTQLNMKNGDLLNYIPRYVAPIVGAAGFIAASAITSYRLYKPTSSRLEICALGVVLFSMGVSIIVALGRAHFFDVFEGQVFAPRYIVWSSLFWSGLLILLIVYVGRISIRPIAMVIATILICFILAYAVLRSEDKWITQSDALYAGAETCLLAIRLGINHDIVPDSCDIFRNEEFRQRFNKTLHLVKDRNIGLFNTSYNHLLGTDPLRIFTKLDTTPMKGDVVLSRVLRDTSTSELFASLQGWAVDADREIAPDMVLIVDDDERIQGIAIPSRLRIKQAKSLGLPKLLRFGLSGFIKNYRPSQNYTAYTVNDNQWTHFGPLIATEKSKKMPD